MGMASSLSTLALMMWFVAPAFAEPVQPEAACSVEYEAAKTATVAGFKPFAVMSVLGDLSHDCRIYAFYAIRIKKWPPSEPVYAARRWTVNLDTPPGTTFTDSRRCDALPLALRELEKVEPPKISVPWLQASKMRVLVLHGTGFRLWSDQGRFPGEEGHFRTHTIEFEGRDYSSLADWNRHLRDLETCWSSDEPRALSDEP